MINKYSFGSIIINGKTYNNDVEVYWDGNVLPWKREESHVIDVNDVKRVIEQKPEFIIIGTGASGIAKVKEDTIKMIQSKGFELIVDLTEKAIYIFNQTKKNGKKVVGLFHLTC